MVLLIAYGFDAGELMPDFMFYVIFTPIVAVTANKMMFASENNMLAKDAVQRMEGITKEKAFQYPEKGRKIKNHDIVFDHVSFTYPGSEAEVLHDISLEIKRIPRWHL